MTFVSITLENNSQRGLIFSSPVETLGFRHRIDKELDLPKFVLRQENMTRVLILENMCKKEIIVMDHRLSGR